MDKSLRMRMETSHLDYKFLIKNLSIIIIEKYYNIEIREQLEVWAQ